MYRVEDLDKKVPKIKKDKIEFLNSRMYKS